MQNQKLDAVLSGSSWLTDREVAQIRTIAGWMHIANAISIDVFGIEANPSAAIEICRMLTTKPTQQQSQQGLGDK
jgi:hypothetical protein